MEGDFIKINESLLPLSWIYGLGVKLRNFCFDVGLLKSRSFHVPVISVGNITVGGTGKTPHVEYLVRLLKEKYHVAVLSRGYKRKTSGFLLANDQTTVRDIGDEPYQMKRKFPTVSIAVDKKRVRGIQRLAENDARLDVVLLDDAFQHRYVKPGVNILLVDYHRLIIYDKLLPAGRLREPLKGKDRADIVIVTKCPKNLKPMEYRVITKAMNLYPYQNLYFTTLDYDAPAPVFPDENAGVRNPVADGNDHSKPLNVLLLTGIASPRQLEEDLAQTMPAAVVTPMTFPDHHQFKAGDIERINSTFDALPQPRCIITTEKDAVRLQTAQGLSPLVRKNIYALPVRISFIQPDLKENFDNAITGYVLKNSRNSILTKGKDDGKPQKPASLMGNHNTIRFK
ncbi:MAG: tetraacyldisaccharide 4'-kinase [Prevotella sp.]|nr:tetraacyldisaccharide 4'-kinase [Prevotella sp.]